MNRNKGHQSDIRSLRGQMCTSGVQTVRIYVSSLCDGNVDRDWCRTAVPTDMTMPAVVRFCAYVLLSTGVPPSLYAECGGEGRPIAASLSKDTAAVVFSGPAMNVDHRGMTQITRFRVERRWKGPATQETLIYTPISATSPAVFVRDRQYVVIAHRLSAKERIRLGVASNADGFGTDVCGDGARPIEAVVEQDFRALGPGHAPIDYRPPVRSPRVIPPLKIKDAAPLQLDDTRRLAGTVIVEMAVDATGKVSDATILRSLTGLDQTALECVKRWEYLPALFNGVPVPYRMTAVVKFGNRE